METQKRYPMPIGPFRDLIEAALVRFQVEGLGDESDLYAQDDLMTPLDVVTERIARHYNASYETVARRVYDIRFEKVKDISFNLADAIVVGLDQPVFWYTNDEVKDLYAAIGADE